MAKIKIKCPICENIFERTQKQVNQVIKRSSIWQCQSCVLITRNKINAKPIGSTRKNKKGYIFEKTKDGWIQQHILVMEKNINRKLNIDEDVHHINFNKTDNRLENLVIMSHAEHTKLHNLMKGKKHGEFK